MEPRLVQQQSQRLILSPQLRQYLRLLQMPVLELVQAVEAELGENPVLEEKPDSRLEEGPGLPGPEEGLGALPRSDGAREVQIGETFDTAEDGDGAMGTSDYADVSGPDSQETQKKRDFRQSLLTRPEALSDYLLWQIRFLDLTERELRIGAEIIGNIDEQGYLRASDEEIAKSLQTETAAVQGVLARIRQLEPPGIAARTLQEALLLQLARRGPKAALAVEMVTHHLPLLEKRDWPHLAKAMNVELQQVRAAAEIVTRLEPRPGRSFYAEQATAVTPDATISLQPDDEEKLRIEIHTERIPELRISNYYRRLLKTKNLDAKTRLYLREKIQAAMNFMKAIQQRKSTLRDITQEIVKAQEEFFEKGFSHLKPLRLKDISERLGVHESTVSRALQGKYISTPQGTIPYKSFFSSRLDTLDGGSESQKSIMEKIRLAVDREDPEHPLSDQEIVTLLKNDGILVARRTVAKYRELLKVLPSYLRRRK